MDCRNADSVNTKSATKVIDDTLTHAPQRGKPFGTPVHMYHTHSVQVRISQFFSPILSRPDPGRGAQAPYHVALTLLSSEGRGGEPPHETS